MGFFIVSLFIGDENMCTKPNRGVTPRFPLKRDKHITWTGDTLKRVC